jgi:hypothetical protein
MKYAVEIGSVSIIYTHIYTPSFIKIGSDIQQLMGGGEDSQTHRHT